MLDLDVKNPEFKAFAAKFRMPSVKPIDPAITCRKCGKPILVRPIYNADELNQFDGAMCSECS